MDLSKDNYRAYIFIEFKRGISASTVYQQLLSTNIPNIPSRTTVFEWHRRFSQGRQTLDDDPRIGRIPSSSSNSNSATIDQLLNEEPRTSLREIAGQLNISKSAVHTIVLELGFRKVCSSWVPHALTNSNKQSRVECAKEFITIFQNNSFQDCCQLWWVFNDADEIIRISLQTLRAISEESYHHEFAKLIEHCKLVIVAKGDYI